MRSYFWIENGLCFSIFLLVIIKAGNSNASENYRFESMSQRQTCRWRGIIRLHRECKEQTVDYPWAADEWESSNSKEVYIGETVIRRIVVSQECKNRKVRTEDSAAAGIKPTVQIPVLAKSFVNGNLKEPEFSFIKGISSLKITGQISPAISSWVKQAAKRCTHLSALQIA